MRGKAAAALFAVIAGGCDGSPFESVGGIPESMFPGAPVMLSDVWSFGPNDVYVIGQGIGLQHFNGDSFEPVDLPEGVFPAFMWGSAANDFWVAGGNSVAQFDGSSWTATTFETSIDITAFHGSGPDDIWAMGSSNRAMHWNGSEWIEHQQGSSFVDAVWVASPTAAWFVGPFELGTWDGQAWTIDDSHELEGESFWGSAPDDVYLADSFGPLYHFDGSAWSLADEEAELNDIWGTSATDIWGVGDIGTIKHFDGEDWDQVDRGSFTTFYQTVHTFTEGDVWIAGWKIKGETPVPVLLRHK